MAFGDLIPETDVSPAAWVVAGVRPFGAGVGSLVPDGFEACARVLHPAELDGADVRWAAVAAANGRIAHAGMEWVAITGSWDYLGRDTQPGLWDVAPADGYLPARAARSLAAVLGRFTPVQRYWFGVWEGYGVLPAGWERRYPRIAMPQRAMYLLAGSRADAGRPIPSFTWEQSATLWWPDDHSWCVATDLDLMSTYVGGSRACVDAIVSSAELEAFEVSPDQSLSWDSDAVNPILARPRF